jgi:hypothetical protein
MIVTASASVKSRLLMPHIIIRQENNFRPPAVRKHLLISPALAF